ncbi:signal peptidase I [Collinsella sp. AGMB00827]|uniref:Signal peptidase I n=1 Tax=Collinsella ureilytica TaxID=2869515 RepID=A0ABS7MLV4_9ACTN|nr:signal peptidase I [Collinsella urealyticum]MBY4798051.1 signal peptidase I [Collinsella urealyticum]
MASKEGSVLQGLIEWVVALGIAVVAALLIHIFVGSPYTVPTGSMIPTIQIGDNIFAQKISLNLGGSVEPGDIVVFKNPNAFSDHDILVKRVIAVGGDTIDFQSGSVYVNGELKEESYAAGMTEPLSAQAPGIELSYPYTLPKNTVWMMGDNREDSADSRYFGPVQRDDLIGIVIFRYWPLNRIGLI